METDAGKPECGKKDGSTHTEADGSIEADGWYAIWLDQYEEDLEMALLDDVREDHE